MSDNACTIGIKEYLRVAYLSFDTVRRRELRLFSVFLPRALLFVEYESESDAPGIVDWSFSTLILTADVLVCG